MVTWCTRRVISQISEGSFGVSRRAQGRQKVLQNTRKSKCAALAVWVSLQHTALSCCTCGDSPLSWQFVSYCCRSSSVCFSLYLCNNQLTASVCSRLLLRTAADSSKKKEKNHMVIGICGEQRKWIGLNCTSQYLCIYPLQDVGQTPHYHPLLTLKYSTTQIHSAECNF